MIEFFNVTKRYKRGGKWVYPIRDINLRVKKGDRIALLGGAGSGKTTVLKLMCGTETPDQGEITRSSRVSWPIPNTNCFSTQLSAAINARFFARIFEEPAEAFVNRVRDMAELGASINQPLSKLPSASKAQLAFSIGVCMDFDVYLFDETVIVGSTEYKKKCADVLTYLGTERGLFIATRSKTILNSFCDQAYVLDGGRACYYADLKEAWAHYKDASKRQEVVADFDDDGKVVEAQESLSAPESGG